MLYEIDIVIKNIFLAVPHNNVVSVSKDNHTGYVDHFDP